MRIISTLLVILVAVTISAQTSDLPSAPGRLVDIGGRRLHVHCQGTGQPTVILEAGASSFALDWSLVQPEIATSNRVCAYDRAGMGWSDARDHVDTHARVVADLHALLQAAGEKPPFVLVGASLGGLYVRLYQLEYPREVLGLVFVDPATETRLFTMLQGRAFAIAELTAEQVASTLPTVAVPLPKRAVQTGTPFDRLPAELYQLRMRLDQRLIDSFPALVPAEVVRESALAQRDALARLLASRAAADNPMRSVPAVVLTRGLDASNDLVQNHAELARLSTNSRHSVIAGSGHEVHLFMPAAVIEAIRDVTAATRGTRLAPR